MSVNKGPSARIRLATNGANVRLEDVSVDDDGEIVARWWNDSRGQKSTAKLWVFKEKPGTEITAYLRVRDDKGAESTTSATFVVGQGLVSEEPPEPEEPPIVVIPGDPEPDVRPGDDLAAIVNGAAPGTVLHIHGPHVYDIGTAELTPAAGVTVRGMPVKKTLVETVGGVPIYAIDAPVKITGTGNNVFNLLNRNNVTLERLDLSGSTYNPNGPGTAGSLTGNVILGGNGRILRELKIHGSEKAGVSGGNATDHLIEDSEITGCGTLRIAGQAAAFKHTRNGVMRRCYVHGNHYYGVWIDCDGTGWLVEDSLITDNYGSGVFNEISRGPSVYRNLLLRGNNVSAVAGRGGMVIASSRNVLVEGVVLDRNGHQSLRIWEDSRAGNGAQGCTSGYYLDGVVVKGCKVVSGPAPRVIWKGQPAIVVSKDGSFANPNGGTVRFEGLTA